MEILTALPLILSAIAGYIFLGCIWIILDTELLGSWYGDVLATLFNIILWPASIAYRIVQAL